MMAAPIVQPPTATATNATPRARDRRESAKPAPVAACANPGLSWSFGQTALRPLAIQRFADPSPPPGFKQDEHAAPAGGGTPIPDDESAAEGGGGAPKADKREAPPAAPVQTAPAGPGPAMTAGAAAARRVAAGLRGGARLDPAVAGRMSRFFGEDVGGVTVHTDAPAASLARDLHARAFTVGERIGFAAGTFAPSRPDGLRLLAHEMTHVVQQRRGLDGEIRRAGIGAPGDRYEVEAELNADRFVTGEAAASVTAPAASGDGATLQLYAASDAVSYATKWATSTNPAYPRDGNDCTNFVSQAVLAGGWAMAGGSCDDRKDDNAWWYGDSQCWYPGVHRSYTWGGAQNFYNFVQGSGRAKAAANISDLDVGDVLQVWYETRVHHSTMVTKKDSSNTYLSYHTNDTLNIPVWGDGGFLGKWDSDKTKYYAWKL